MVGSVLDLTSANVHMATVETDVNCVRTYHVVDSIHNIIANSNGYNTDYLCITIILKVSVPL